MQLGLDDVYMKYSEGFSYGFVVKLEQGCLIIYNFRVMMEEAEPFIDYFDSPTPNTQEIDELRRIATPLIISKYKKLAEGHRCKITSNS